jgi:hypothetical protein
VSAADDRPTAAEGGRSAFLPVFIVFLAFTVGYSLQLVQVFAQNAEIRRADAASEQALVRAPTMNARLQAVAKDLAEASATSPGARQLLGELGARPSQPPR